MSAGYGDHAIAFDLRASVGGEHNIWGQQYIEFELTIVVYLMWVHLMVKPHGQYVALGSRFKLDF